MPGVIQNPHNVMTSGRAFGIVVGSILGTLVLILFLWFWSSRRPQQWPFKYLPKNRHPASSLASTSSRSSRPSAMHMDTWDATTSFAPPASVISPANRSHSTEIAATTTNSSIDSKKSIDTRALPQQSTSTSWISKIFGPLAAFWAPLASRTSPTDSNFGPDIERATRNETIRDRHVSFASPIQRFFSVSNASEGNVLPQTAQRGPFTHLRTFFRMTPSPIEEPTLTIGRPQLSPRTHHRIERRYTSIRPVQSIEPNLDPILLSPTHASMIQQRSLLAQTQSPNKPTRKYQKTSRSIRVPSIRPVLAPIVPSPPLAEMIRLKAIVEDATPPTLKAHTPNPSKSTSSFAFANALAGRSTAPSAYAYTLSDSPVPVPPPLRIRPKKHQKYKPAPTPAPTASLPPLPRSLTNTRPRAVVPPKLETVTSTTATRSHPTTTDGFTANARLSPFSPLKPDVWSPQLLQSTVYRPPPGRGKHDYVTVGIAPGSPRAVVLEVEEGEGRRREGGGKRISQMSVFMRHPGDEILSGRI